MKLRRCHKLVGGFLLLTIPLAGALLFYYFWLRWPMGNGPAGPPVPNDEFKQPWITQPVLLVGVGDSVTAGFGARIHYSYFDRLIENPADEFEGLRGICLSKVIPDLHATNLAMSGSTSFQHLQKELPHIPPVDSNTVGIVLMTTGGNDLIHNYGRTAPSEKAMFGATLAQAQPWISGFADRLEKMLKQIESSFPGGYEIFLADIYDPTDGTGDARVAGLPRWPDSEKILRQYNEVIYQFASKHPRVHVVRIHDAFLGHGIHCAQPWSAHYQATDPHFWYFENLEDPNERGYDVIRRLFLIEIAKSIRIIMQSTRAQNLLPPCQ